MTGPGVVKTWKSLSQVSVKRGFTVPAARMKPSNSSANMFTALQHAPAVQHSHHSATQNKMLLLPQAASPEARMKPRNSGLARPGLDLNSGWNCTQQGESQAPSYDSRCHDKQGRHAGAHAPQWIGTLTFGVGTHFTKWMKIRD
jgi:hypothetical protein